MSECDNIMLERHIESFRIGSKLVEGTSELRLDASFYNPRVLAAVASLDQSDMEIRPLGEVAERVFIPPRFKRVYVDAAHGVPFLQGSHVLQLQITDLKYLSVKAHRDLQRWIIRSGWILVTCSGTVGRVTVTPPHWDGWAASQHILRIIPREDKDCPAGYLATYLASPLGQVQLTAQIYGAVVDELTEEQARSVRVPIPRTRAQRLQVKKINELAVEARQRRTEAVMSAESAARSLDALLPSSEPAQRQDQEHGVAAVHDGVSEISQSSLA
jgi:Type I restriction modification DNA specificity domain